MKAHGLSTLLLGVVLCFHGCGGSDPGPEEPYRAPPEFIGERMLSSDGEVLAPLGLQIHRDTLFVSYPKTPRIDAYSLDLERLDSISLEDPEPVSPTSFFVTDSWIVVSDSEKRLIVLYDRNGKVVDSFGLLPDRKARLSPGSLVIYGGVLYAADMALGRVLAVSLADAAGITEVGELILTIPAGGEEPLGLPGGVHVTNDGRVLIGDIDTGSIDVFTCDGRAIYSFASPETAAPVGVQAFAVDDQHDPSLASAEGFDPSGVRELGRIHALDRRNGLVHMFNPLGDYLLSYPEPGILEGPSGIAIDPKSRQVFIADPLRGSLLIYRYMGERSQRSRS